MLYRTIKPLIVDAVQLEEPTDVRTDTGVLHANRGDWLIRDTQGNITRCDDATFKCTFDKLAAWKNLEDLSEGRPCGC